ncbi:MAG: hypothetical protein H0W15_03870 [Gemmatimonadales bacterium]|nr:hypothetical protein [Gemmatimonadales bacterium]
MSKAGSRRHHRHLAAFLGMMVMGVGQVSAQIDYRNLDDERPVFTEDAYPIERHVFELLVPYRYEREADGGRVHSTVLELGYGIFDNAQFGVHVPFAVVDDPARTDFGLAGVQPFLLYNFNTESRSLPALALRADLSIPVGPLGGSGTRGTVRAIATRSWGLTRLHLNALRSFGSEEELSVAEPARRWTYSAAVDRTMLRQSMLLVAEIVTSRAVADAPVEVNAGVGVRWQWTPTIVLDAGVTRRLREHGPDIGLTFGLSHAFAVRGLMPSGLR